MNFPVLTERVLSYDIETKDKYLTKKGKRPSLGSGAHRHYLAGEDSYILCVSISDSKNDYCFPASPELFQWMKSIEPDHIWVAHNGLYDMSWLYYEGFIPKKMADTQGLARLLHEDRLSYSLDNLSKDFLGVGKHEDEIAKWCRDRKLSGSPQQWLWKMVEEGYADLVYKYARIDTRRTYDLYMKLIPEIEKQNLGYIWGIECELLPILVRMNHKGMRIDNEHRHKMIGEAYKEEARLAEKINRITGRVVVEGKSKNPEALNLGSGKQLKEVFDRLGLRYSVNPPTETMLKKGITEGNASFTSDELLPYGVTPDETYLPHLIVLYKKMQKLRRDFLEKLELFIIGDRIYPTIYPWGTKTGRPTAQAPNIFQVPKRGKGKKICRPLFLPEEGEIFVSADYASEELRVFAHYARGTSGQKYRDAYNDTSIKYDMHEENAKTAGCDRNKAKTIGLGVLFGMGQKKLATNLGVGDAEGMKILTRFFEKNPSFKQTGREAMQYAQKFGYIQTISGRKRRFPGGDGAYKALNFLTQGNSGDIAKITIVKANRAGLLDKMNFLFYLYDEYDVSIKEENMNYFMQFKEIAENAIPLKVKMLLEVETGPNWGDISEWKG